MSPNRGAGGAVGVRQRRRHCSPGHKGTCARTHTMVATQVPGPEVALGGPGRRPTKERQQVQMLPGSSETGQWRGRAGAQGHRADDGSLRKARLTQGTGSHRSPCTRRHDRLESERGTPRDVPHTRRGEPKARSRVQLPRGESLARQVQGKELGELRPLGSANRSEAAAVSRLHLTGSRAAGLAASSPVPLAPETRGFGERTWRGDLAKARSPLPRFSQPDSRPSERLRTRGQAWIAGLAPRLQAGAAQGGQQGSGTRHQRQCPTPGPFCTSPRSRERRQAKPTQSPSLKILSQSTRTASSSLQKFSNFLHTQTRSNCKAAQFLIFDFLLLPNTLVSRYKITVCILSGSRRLHRKYKVINVINK